MSEAEAVRARLATIVGAIARQALVEWRVSRIALLDDGSPEARLAAEWLTAALPEGSLVRVAEPRPGLEPLLQPAAADGEGAARLREEALRLTCRLVPDALPAHPANKTALLLGGALPPEPFLPLGDLYASQVEAVSGGWSAPAETLALAERAGGVAVLDAALAARLDARGAAGLDRLPGEVRSAVEDALRLGAASRVVGRLVPKLGSRTLGVDLYE